MIPFAIFWSIWNERNERIFRGSSSSVIDLIDNVAFRIAKWASIRKEFTNIYLNDIIYNWEACMGCLPFKERRSVPWSSPLFGVLKFNVDGASRGKLG